MKTAPIAGSRLNTGAVGRNRTGDLLITNQLLYQLSYNSVCLFARPFKESHDQRNRAPDYSSRLKCFDWDRTPSSFALTPSVS